MQGISSDASKEWSGTKSDFKKKKKKLEKKLQKIMKQHLEYDQRETGIEITAEAKEKTRKNILATMKKIDNWVDNNEDKMGSGGKKIMSNITDNDSAKMPSSQGVIQGFNNTAAVDSKHQVIVGAQSFGVNLEKTVFKEIIEETEKNLKEIDKELKDAKSIMDFGFFSKDNLEILDDKGIDGYIPDRDFRKRDERFETAERHKICADRHRTNKKRKYFGTDDFVYDEETKKLICPLGCELKLKTTKYVYRGREAAAYISNKEDCKNCSLKSKCMRNPETKRRQVVKFYDNKNKRDILADKMKEKIDSAIGRYIYSKRMQIVEPVFANIRHNMKLNRQTLRTKEKVDIQWKLFAIVHNLKKIYRFGPVFL